MARSVERIGDPMPLPRASRVGFQLQPDMAVEIIASMYNQQLFACLL
jgi:hypothetical protein